MQVYDCCRQPVEDDALAWPELPPRLSLLCAADCRGRVSVFASSLFPLAEVDVGALAGSACGADGGVHVLQVARLRAYLQLLTPGPHIRNKSVVHQSDSVLAEVIVAALGAVG